MAAGRPTIYSEELADLICRRVATHTIGIPKLCAMYDDMPSYQTINVWRYEKKSFSDKYAESKRFQAEFIAESLIDMCEVETYKDEKGVTRVDAGMVAKQRLLVDTVKWHASKLAPKIYGDKKQVEEATPADTLTKIQALVADLNKTNVSDI